MEQIILQLNEALVMQPGEVLKPGGTEPLRISYGGTSVTQPTTGGTMFDKIFAGQNGLANKLMNSFGSTVTLSIIGDKTYHKETDTYTSTPARTFSVKWVEEKLHRGFQQFVNTVLVEAGDLIGMIPAGDYGIRINRDIINVKHIEYVIIATEPVSTGTQTAYIRLLCRMR